MQIRFCQSLINSGLIRAEGAAALHDQRNSLERRALGHHMGFSLRWRLVKHREPACPGAISHYSNCRKMSGPSRRQGQILARVGFAAVQSCSLIEEGEDIVGHESISVTPSKFW